MELSNNTVWGRMTPQQRLTAATVDIMQHKDFALLSGVVMMGKAEMSDAFPTAGTDGLDCFYGSEFMALQDRMQWRWVILHENFHKAFHHCVDYTEIVLKYTLLSNIAQDFVINGTIDEMDPTQAFAKQPSGIKICLDKKYYGWDWIAVLRDLLKQRKNGSGSGSGVSKPGQPGEMPGDMVVFDKHISNKKAEEKAKGSTQAENELKKMKQQIQDALHQGKMTAQRMAGKNRGTNALAALTKQRNTDWKTPLKEFIETICSGYDNSRFCPPNKRFLPLDILMPSHFSETLGEIQVYCDTSGSMTEVYPIVFGEIARIAQQVKPACLRIIWWDDGIQGEQLFTEKNYAEIAHLINPTGGGGTSPNCVVKYVAAKQYKPKAGIWLSDGYLDASNAILPWPVIWGCVDNEAFCAPQGKKINIYSNV